MQEPRGDKRSSPPPNISIAFEGGAHSSSKAIARAFNRQFAVRSVPQDRTLRRLMREIHRNHPVDLSYSPFDERGVAAAIRKEGSSTAQGPGGLTMLHFYHLWEHVLAFLTEHFNLSVAGVDIPAIRKNTVIIFILKAGKPREQGRSYRPISLLFSSAKILE